MKFRIPPILLEAVVAVLSLCVWYLYYRYLDTGFIRTIIGIVLFGLVFIAAVVALTLIRQSGFWSNGPHRVLVPAIMMSIIAPMSLSDRFRRHDAIIVNETTSNYLLKLNDEHIESKAGSVLRLRPIGNAVTINMMISDMPSTLIEDTLIYNDSFQTAIVNIETKAIFVEETIRYSRVRYYSSPPPEYVDTFPRELIFYTDADYVLVDPPAEIRVQANSSFSPVAKRRVRKLDLRLEK